MYLKESDCSKINFNQSFFDSIKEDYPSFIHWNDKIQPEKRPCYIVLNYSIFIKLDVL